MALDRRTLPRLRKLCLGLPETTETQSWGHPNWKAGKKIFAAWETYSGTRYIAFKADPDEFPILTEQDRFRAAPHGGKWGWVMLDAASDLDWDELTDWIETSYRSVALKRMLRVLAR